MAITIAKAMNLVLDRRTIARPTTLDRAGKERRLIEIVTDDCVSFGIGPRDRAGELRQPVLLRRIKKRHRPIGRVGRLPFQPRPIDRASIETGQRARLEAAHRQFKRAQLNGKFRCRMLIDPATGHPLQTTEHDAAQKSARRQHNGPSGKLLAIRQTDAGHSARRIEIERDHLPADDLHQLMRPKQRLHRAAITEAIGLDTRPPDSSTLARVEHAAMDRGGIGRSAHDAIERIDFANEMPLPQPANRWIAGHLTDAARVGRDQSHMRTTARSRRSSLRPGMAAAYNDHVEGGHGERPSPSRRISQKALRWTGGVRCFTWNRSTMTDRSDHLPMQKPEKSSSRTDSVVARPVISSSADKAIRRDSPIRISSCRSAPSTRA